MTRPDDIRQEESSEKLERLEEGIERLERIEREAERVTRPEPPGNGGAERSEGSEARKGAGTEAESVASANGSGATGSGDEDDCLCESCKITLQLKDAHLRGVMADGDGDCFGKKGNGEGFKQRSLVMSDEKRVLGLFGMIERIELAGCSLRFDFRPDEGTTIHLEVPIEPEEGTR